GLDGGVHEPGARPGVAEARTDGEVRLEVDAHVGVEADAEPEARPRVGAVELVLRDGDDVLEVAPRDEDGGADPPAEEEVHAIGDGDDALADEVEREPLAEGSALVAVAHRELVEARVGEAPTDPEARRHPVEIAEDQRAAEIAKIVALAVGDAVDPNGLIESPRLDQRPSTDDERRGGRFARGLGLLLGLALGLGDTRGAREDEEEEPERDWTHGANPIPRRRAGGTPKRATGVTRWGASCAGRHSKPTLGRGSMATRNILSRAVLGCVPALLSLALASCAVDPAFDPKSPSRGPGQFVGRDAPLNEVFSGGVSPTPAPNPAPNPDGLCDADCHAYCESLDLQNPVDVALCPSIWGVGKATRPIDEVEACRRLYADLAGYFPSLYEIERSCVGQDLGEVARRIIRTQDYVDVQRRLWADRLRYNDLVVNVERIFDADDVVQKTYRGLLRYDEMVHVMSAHPVLTRRYDSAGDRVEALFVTFFGRPPFENERADMAKLYTLWVNGYFDHPVLGVRVPDAYIEH